MNSSPELIRRSEPPTAGRPTARVAGDGRCDVAEPPAETRASANLALLYGGARPAGPPQAVWGEDLPMPD